MKGRPSISMPTDTEEDEFEWSGMLNNVSGYKLTLIASSFYSTSDVQILLIRKSEMKSIKILKKKKKMEYRHVRIINRFNATMMTLTNMF